MINAETICHQDLSCIISHLPHVAKIISTNKKKKKKKEI